MPTAFALNALGGAGMRLDGPKSHFWGLGGTCLPTALGTQIEMEEEGVQLAADLEAALIVPDEGRTVVAKFLGEGLKAVRGVDKLEDAIN